MEERTVGTEVSVTPPARLSWGNLAGQNEHAGRKEGKAAEVTPLAVQGDPGCYRAPLTA